MSLRALKGCSAREWTTVVGKTISPGPPPLSGEIMATREQYEQFDEWLRGRYRECLRAWNTAENPEVKAKYDALLERICHDVKWVHGKVMLIELQEDARTLIAMVE